MSARRAAERTAERAGAARRRVLAEHRRLAERYDRRWARYLATSRAALLSDRALWGRPGRLLDVGCGTGALLAAARAAGSRRVLIGVDLSEAMLSVARTRARGVPLVCAPAERLPFADAAFDAAVCANALHLSPAPARALGEIARALRPGARFALSDWCPDSRFTRWMLRWLKASGRVAVLAEDSSILRRQLDAAGFDWRSQRRDRCGPWTVLTVDARRRALR